MLILYVKECWESFKNIYKFQFLLFNLFTKRIKYAHYPMKFHSLCSNAMFLRIWKNADCGFFFLFSAKNLHRVIVFDCKIHSTDQLSFFFALPQITCTNVGQKKTCWMKGVSMPTPNFMIFLGECIFRYWKYKTCYVSLINTV